MSLFYSTDRRLGDVPIDSVRNKHTSKEGYTHCVSVTLYTRSCFGEKNKNNG